MIYPARFTSPALVLAPAIVLACLLVMGARPQGAPPERLGLETPSEKAGPEAWAAHFRALAALGDGFVVWESDRTGTWRIFLRRLDGTGLRQLSPDEPGRAHVAAHVAPDGRHVAYLSLEAPHESFGSTTGRLDLLAVADGKVRVLTKAARPYRQSRSIVWLDSRRLLYIAGDGTTRELDIVTGEEDVVIGRQRPEYGMLLNPGMTHATSGWPTFADYDSEAREVFPRRRLYGCQPYFSHDDRFGYWVEGAGGPVKRLDLASRAEGVMLAKRSRHLPPDRGYVYYPMVSHDQRLLAVGASRDEHGHFGTDFDIFVLPLDPETLTVRGSGVRMSFHPAQDRFPDVHVAGLELGRHRGEVPFTPELAIPAPRDAWRVDWGDGTSGPGSARHVYAQAGTYPVRATHASSRVLRGEVVVAPAAPPAPLHVEVRPGGKALLVIFDEPVDASEASLRLASGTSLGSIEVRRGGRALWVELGARLAKRDVLHVSGIRDRAHPPHAMQPTSLEVARGGDWPVHGEGAVFVFETRDGEQMVQDPETGRVGEPELEGLGRARYDAHGAMDLAKGSMRVADLPSAFAQPFRASSEITVELTVRSDALSRSGWRPVLSLRDAGDGRFTLLQKYDRLALRLRTDDPNDPGRVELGRLEPKRPHHWVVSYAPGRLAAWKDGRLAFESGTIHGTLAAWDDGLELFFGGQPGGRDWQGRIEGVALYARILAPAEAASHAETYLTAVRRREPVKRLEVRARASDLSLVPTPEEISPYREALVVHEYDVVKELRGKLGGARRLRVAHWAVLNGDSQPLPVRQPGQVTKLVLEPLGRYPHLEEVFTSDTLEVELDVPMFLDVSS